MDWQKRVSTGNYPAATMLQIIADTNIDLKAHNRNILQNAARQEQEFVRLAKKAESSQVLEDRKAAEEAETKLRSHYVLISALTHPTTPEQQADAMLTQAKKTLLDELAAEGRTP